jgi:hypothetical protein
MSVLSAEQAAAVQAAVESGEHVDLAAALQAMIAAENGANAAGGAAPGADPPNRGLDDEGDSSGSDDDRRRRVRRARPKTDGVRLATSIHAAILDEHKNAKEYVRYYDFKKERNRKEAERIASYLDEALRIPLSLKQDLMEMLLRNLAALCEVDRTSNTALLDKMALRPPKQLIPMDYFRAITKDVERDEKVFKTANRTFPKNKKKAPGAGQGAGGT